MPHFDHFPRPEEFDPYNHNLHFKDEQKKSRKVDRKVGVGGVNACGQPDCKKCKLYSILSSLNPAPNKKLFIVAHLPGFCTGFDCIRFLGLP